MAVEMVTAVGTLTIIEIINHLICRQHGIHPHILNQEVQQDHPIIIILEDTVVLIVILYPEAIITVIMVVIRAEAGKCILAVV
jgi:hypothetical protein